MVYYIFVVCYFSSIKFYHKKDYKAIFFDRLVVLFFSGCFFTAPFVFSAQCHPFTATAFNNILKIVHYYDHSFPLRYKAQKGNETELP